MNHFDYYLMWFAIVLPALAACAMLGMRHIHAIRRLSWVCLSLQLCMLGSVLVRVALLTSNDHDDPEHLIGALCTSILSLVACVASARHTLGRREYITLLLTAACVEGFFCATSFAAATGFWVAMVLPCYVLLKHAKSLETRIRLRRTYAIFLLGGTLPMLVAMGLAYAAFWDNASATLVIPVQWQLPLLSLVLLAALVRMAAFPFHAWLPTLLEDGPVGIAVVLVGINSGLFMLMRTLPLFSDAFARAVPLLTGIALLTTLAGSIIAMTQTEMRRMIAYLMMSQSGLVLAGFAAINTQSLTGALVHALAVGLSLCGLLLIISALHARVGTADMFKLGGLVQQTPRLTTAFLLFGCASIGIPGFVMFVTEDVLVAGVLIVHPAIIAAMLFAMALNGVTVFRAYSKALLGQPHPQSMVPDASPVDDLIARERWTVVALIAVLIGLGLCPRALVSIAVDSLQASQMPCVTDCDHARADF